MYRGTPTLAQRSNRRHRLRFLGQIRKRIVARSDGLLLYTSFLGGSNHQNGCHRSWNSTPILVRNLVEDLIPGTRYEFALRSSNALGYSKTANLSIETPQIPAMPTPGTDRTPQPTVVDRPMLTPTESSTVTEAGKTQASRRHSRDVDPDPPEDFNAVQGRDGVVIYWDNPRWDGGYDILAYAVDWYPETLQFPLFLPPTEHSARIRGLKPDINYRMRVQAFNLKDNGLPAIARIEVAESLIKLRSYDPFTGSIAYNRSTTLKNAAQLPGLEVHADADTMFWGDEMVFSIERLPLRPRVAQCLSSRRAFRSIRRFRACCQG